MLNRIPTVQVCDASEDAQGTKAGNKKSIRINLCNPWLKFLILAA